MALTLDIKNKKLPENDKEEELQDEEEESEYSNCPCIEELSEIFLKLFLICHVKTKTTDSTFHNKSAEWYKFADKCMHQISELRQDLGLDEAEPLKDAAPEAYEALEEVKGLLEEMLKEKNSTAMRVLLETLSVEAEGHCGDARAFLAESQE